MGRLLAATVAAAIAAGTAAASASTGRAVHTYSTRGTLPLRTALLDTLFEDAGQSDAFTMARAAGASFLRLPVSWASIAPGVPPPGFVATDPASPGYSWSGLDATVEATEAAGLTPILDIGGPPSWAYARPPSGTGGGTPQVALLGEFARALAMHYDGSDGLPAVHVFQVWNEPNNSLDLSPTSPAVYRAMVNAVAASVHAVDHANLVVAGGLDPFRTATTRFRSVAPLAYMRALLCLSQGAHPHATCHAPAHFDVWSHHPYTFGGPFGHARRKDDVSLGDLPEMRALLRAAVRLHHVVSAHPVQFWVTEFGWDSKPPRHGAAPMRIAARWTAESLYQMWRSGVSLVTWFLLEDRASPSPYQSGLYFYAPSLAQARAKPVLTAYRFPFVAYLGRRAVRVWGRDATSDKRIVTVQRRHGSHGRWRTVARIRSNRFGIFEAALRLKATKRDWLRAAAPGAGRSLAFSLTRPHDPHIGPWGN